MRDFFRGKYTLRTRGEWLSLWLTLLLAPIFLSIVGEFIHTAGISTVILLAVVAMIYVTLARGQLLGSSVLIDKRHFPEIFHAVERCSSLIGIPVPLVFVRDDIQIPVVALGFGEPYSLVLSSHWLKHFKEDELTFMIGRELGNIAAGHTRITSLLSVNGKENALISIFFGAWLRRTEYTADRFGLLCCGSVDAAERAITMATFHHFGRDVDITAFARQREEFGGDSVLNMGEWLSSQPYATNRMARLKAFRESVLYTYWEERLLHSPVALAPYSPVPRSGKVTRADCAGFGRRAGALLIDMIVVGAIFSLTPLPQGAAESTSPHTGTPAVTAGGQHVDVDVKERLLRLVGVYHSPKQVSAGGKTVDENYTILPTTGFVQEFMIYSFVLIALGGQTLGMMILAIKVTTTTFRRPPIWQAVWRSLVLPLGVLTYLLGPLARIELHDRLSGTRVVRLERTFERATVPA